MKHLMQKYICLAILITLTATGVTVDPSEGPYAEKIKRIEAFVTKQMKWERTPGMSVGFMKDDFVWARGFGYADLENKSKANADSAYRLASVTKSMTAVAVLQLAEKGKIDLDAEVQKYVPYFPRKPWPVTVRQLLGHLGGISHYRDYQKEGHIKVPKDTREAIAIFEDFDLVAEPGTQYNYSSYGYNLLGAVIEGAARQPYGEYMREHVWQPLDMTHTFMDIPDNLIPGKVRGYRLIDGQIKNSEYIDISSRFAAGGTRSTVTDLLRFARGIIDGKLLSAETTAEMLTSMVNKEGVFTGYGMGWRINPVNGRFGVEHSGAQAETRTHLVLFPREKFSVAVACNFEGSNPIMYASRLYQILYDEPVNGSLYSGEKVNKAILSAVEDVFNEGLSAYKRFRKPVGEDGKNREEAFSFFNRYVNPKTLQKDYKGTLKEIRTGKTLKTGRAFIQVGSYMAARLEEKFGPARMETYHQEGAIPFFLDYIKIFSSDDNFPEAFRFNEDLAEMIRSFWQSWQKSSSREVQRLILTPDIDWGELGKKLKQAFSRCRVYPDLNRDFARIVEYYYINGKKDQALKAARLAVELYPQSAQPLVFLANAHICSGDEKKAETIYKQAMQSEFAKGHVSPRGLIYYASNLVDYGKIEPALRLLRMGLKIYPRSADLHYYLGIALQDKAAGYFREALQLDPTHENARKRLKKFE